MDQEKTEMELTILMPCLNESETLAVCIWKARRFLEENHIDGEVLISDNGSTDNSREIAAAEGSRVVMTPERGYGAALINGTKEAYGKYVIMGDADDSYDFLNLMPFLEKLREGYDLVMGNRFAGGIEKGAMPFSHRYIGNLSRFQADTARDISGFGVAVPREVDLSRLTLDQPYLHHAVMNPLGRQYRAAGHVTPVTVQVRDPFYHFPQVLQGHLFANIGFRNSLYLFFRQNL